MLSAARAAAVAAVEVHHAAVAGHAHGLQGIVMAANTSTRADGIILEVDAGVTVEVEVIVRVMSQVCRL